MLAERKGNRLTAQVRSEKTKALGWKASRTIKSYIDSQKAANWKL